MVKGNDEIFEDEIEIEYKVDMDIADWGIKEFNVYSEDNFELELNNGELLKIDLKDFDNEVELMGGYDPRLIILGLYLAELHIILDSKNTVCVVDIVGG